MICVMAGSTGTDDVAARHRFAGAWGWSVVLLVVAVALLYRALLRPPLDLQVYLLGGSIVVGRGDDLYAASAVTSAGLPFTYPPFGAVLFVPSALVGLTASSVVIVLVSLGCLIRMCYLVIVGTRFCDSYRVSVPTATVLACLATVVAEPATTNLSLGQVNIILCWAVVEDVIGRRRWFSGALVGVAVGVKLVPAIFIVYFLLTRRWREAAVSFGVAAATVIVGAIMMPRSSGLYWSSLGELQNRVAGDPLKGDGLDQVGNQSVLGALHRLVGEEVRPVWVVIAALILIIAGVRVWSARGPDQAVESVVVLALAGLLVSPVSWTPHWIWITPLVVVLLVRAKETPSARGWLGALLAAVWVFTVAIRVVWLGDGTGADPEIAKYNRMLAANSYVLLAVLSLAYLCWPTGRSVNALAQRRKGSGHGQPECVEAGGAE
jgi:alpha-1,2-mannosyltransferase